MMQSSILSIAKYEKIRENELCFSRMAETRLGGLTPGRDVVERFGAETMSCL